VQPTARPNTPNFGVIALFNNRVGIDFATINSVRTSYDVMTQSYLQEGQVFQPTDFLTTFVYPEVEDSRAFSNSLSSAQYLPNGNVLALSGRYGFAYELNPNQEIVWTYIVPFRGGTSVMQGDILDRNNNVTFRIERYPLEYPAFEDRELTPTGYLELAPNTDFCGMLVVTEEVEKSEQEIRVFPNPTQHYLSIEVAEVGRQTVKMYSINGRLIKTILMQNRATIDIQDLPTGIYILKTEKNIFKKVLKY